MANRIPIGKAIRTGNVHAHKGSEWVRGSYHDGWHPIWRKHKGITETGELLHTEHARQAKEENESEDSGGKKRKLMKEVSKLAEYPGRCSNCDKYIATRTPIWWNPKTKGVRHRGVGCDQDVEYDEDYDGDEITYDENQDDVEMVTKQEAGVTLAAFKDAIEKIAEKFEADKKEMADDFAAQVAKLSKKVESARKIEVTIPAAEGKKSKTRKMGIQHEQFPDLLQHSKPDVNIALVGDAGSGKSRGPRELARALGTNFYLQPFGPQTTKSDVLGFINGQGKYIYSMLRHVYEFGGVGCCDEMDASNAASLTILNGMLDSIEAGFADKMVTKHKDCRFVACMNTYGRGADLMFVGRSQQDAATLSRWAYIEWNTDWNLTMHLTKQIIKDAEPWVNYIHAVYDSAIQNKVRIIVGMRTSLIGARLMRDGASWEKAERMSLWAPVKPDDKQKVLAGVPDSVRNPALVTKQEDDWGEDDG